MFKIKRAIHFDFHTQQKVYDVGMDFDAQKFAQTLADCHVKYTTFFARCNRGFSYYPTKIGVPHPSLNGKDMLGDVIRECHKRNIGVTAYFNSVLNQAVANTHPQWTRSRNMGGENISEMCFNTEYTDYLASEVREVLEMYPDVDGIFLDCIGLAAPCLQEECLAEMQERGIDKNDIEQLIAFDHEKKIEAARRVRDVVLPKGKYFFCNGIKELQEDADINEKFNTHGEIESVPGFGAWGYDCFPTLISYYRHFYRNNLYMAGIFHVEWGDFGGLRSAASLEYDAFNALAFGAQIMYGDALHPRGELKKAFMDIVKNVYSQVEAVEKWTDEAEYVPEIGVYVAHNKTKLSRNTFIENLDTFKGAQRMLAELKYQFDFVDNRCDLSKYKLLILPDEMTLDSEEQANIQAFLQSGGKIIASGFSAMNPQKTSFMSGYPFEFTRCDSERSFFEITDEKTKENVPDMVLAAYHTGICMKGKTELASYIEQYDVEPSDFMYFPPDKKTGESAVLRSKNITHIAFKPFLSYAKTSYPPHKYLVENLIKQYLEEKLITCDLPSFARATLTETECYTLLHILCYCPERRPTPIIEEPIELFNKSFVIKTKKPVKKVYAAPSMEPLAFTQNENGVSFTVDRVIGHKIIVLEY